MRVLINIIFILALSTCVSAQQTTAQKVNDTISYVTVFSNIGLDTISAFRAPDRKCSLISEGIKIGSTIAISELLKHFINEERPDNSDNKSFPSEHTALAMTTSGWSVGFGLSLGIGTGVERVTANKHHWWDTLAGGSIGYGINIAVTKSMNCREN